MRISFHEISLFLAIVLMTTTAPATPEALAARSAQYAVATANPYATDAGMRVLATGGSAVDAAVAIQMVLGVVEPQSSGLGGGAMALYRSASDRRVRAFDGLAKSPATYDPGAGALPGFSHSGASVGTPSALRMLELMHRRYGRLPWNTLFRRAIELADTGFGVSPYLARSLAAAAKRGMAVPSWLSDGTGKPETAGATIRNLELATTLGRIAAGGGDAFYIGFATDISDSVRNATIPGRLSVEDIAGYQAVERNPLCLQSRWGQICSVPPPSYGGVAVLERLGILENFGTVPFSFADLTAIHRFIEAGRMAEADRMQRVGDRDLDAEAVSDLLRPGHLSARAALIRDRSSLSDPVSRAQPTEAAGAGCALGEHAPAPSTSEVSIVDASENALAMTTTINVNFGAWITVGGFFLNDAMTNFALPTDAGCSANSPAGGKRAETAMAPVLGMDTTGRVALIGGSAGAGEIVDYVTQAVLELEAGRPPTESLDDGHVSTARAPYPDSAGLVELEEGRAVAQFARPLRELGHKVAIVSLQSGTAFLIRRQERWDGAADPRRDGVFESSGGGSN